MANILVVDDDPLVTTSLGRLLELETPHRIRCCSSGAQALEAIRAAAPDLIITDLSMPGMDGLELLRRARALAPDAARIILTGYADKESAIRGINEGGIFMFIEKPWDNQELLITVENALAHVELSRALVRTIDELRQRNAELERALAELRDAQGRLIASERLAAVGRLAAGIAHGIGNQLSLLTFAELLAEKYAGDPTAQQYTAPILAARRRLASMVGSIRDYLRGGNAVTAARDPLPLAPIVDEAVDILRFEPGIKLRTLTREPADPAVVAKVNREQILQVLINLIRNALHATPEGGHIRIGVERRGERAILAVADDGVGIPPENLERIWEPFFSTKGDAGTGLGLGICKRIIEDHGGTIEVRSKPGEGAVFTVSLPAA